VKSAAHPPLLSVSRLSVHLPTEEGWVRTVDGVSFTLDHGRTLAVVGESGCGKSMLCRAIPRLLPFRARTDQESRILFEGRELGVMKERALNAIRGREIGMIFQDPMTSLNPVLKVGIQIGESLEHHLNLGRRQALARAAKLLKETGVDSPEQRMSHYPHQLSGGQRQRAAIAMALACAPKLLIADEPTTALDVTVQAEILRLLNRRRVQGNMAMIFVSHDLSVAAGLAHEIAVMYAGKFVEMAPAPKFFERARHPYARALLDSVPRPRDPPHTILKEIGGQPPSPMDSHPGCPFAPRCPRARSRCPEEEPPLKSHEEENHQYACWNPVPRNGRGS